MLANFTWTVECLIFSHDWCNIPMLSVCFPVEVCIFITWSSWIPSRFRYYFNSVSGISILFILWFTLPFGGCSSMRIYQGSFWVTYSIFLFIREGISMVPGSNILDWNTLTILLKGPMQPTRYKIMPSKTKPLPFLWGMGIKTQGYDNYW